MTDPSKDTLPLSPPILGRQNAVGGEKTPYQKQLESEERRKEKLFKKRFKRCQKKREKKLLKKRKKFRNRKK